MNRTIKFRAWDGVRITEDTGIQESNFLASGIVFMQFTGLKDKNGKEIYEGDIMKSLTPSFDCVAEVVWNKGGFWSLKDDDDMVLGECLYNYQLEIIGNIYENPELIK